MKKTTSLPALFAFPWRHVLTIDDPARIPPSLYDNPASQPSIPTQHQWTSGSAR
jgi:hypothetical protein